MKIIEKHILTFKNSDGYINYHYIDLQDPFDAEEYAEPNDPIWNKAKIWIAIDIIEVKTRGQKLGKKLLSEFIDSLSSSTGILLNPSPQYNDMEFDTLKDWYIDQDFDKVDKYGNTLSYVV